MEYTIKKLATLAGISTRTLRYYDEIGLLKPKRISSSGYRIYGEKEVDMLQQILFYRELGVDLNSIKDIINSSSFDRIKALKDHREKLLTKRKQLDLLINNVDKTIALSEGRIKMRDEEKFEGFKKSLIEENEKKYGKEIREKYGKEVVESSNAKLMNMSEEQYSEFLKLSDAINDTLKEAVKTNNPAGELAQKAADLHRQWLCLTWPKYTKEAHAGLANMYVCDERFKAYYDKIEKGAAEFLKEAILIYTGMNEQ